MDRTLAPLLAALLCLTGVAHGVEPPASQPATVAEEEPETLTGDWFGRGRRLAERGIETELCLTQLFQQNVRGGQSAGRRAGRYSGRYSLDVAFDLEKLAGWTGGGFQVQARGGWSDGISSPSVGDLFNVNALAWGDQAIDVNQAYYEQRLAGDRLIARLGKMDLKGGFDCCNRTVAFDNNHYANSEECQFINGALVNNPTVPFPDEGLAAALFARPVEWWYLAAASADADADRRETGFKTAFRGGADFFNILETGITPAWRTALGPLPGAYRIGLWYDPQPKPRLDDASRSGRDDLGFYLSADQMVWRENPDPADEQGLGLFARHGLADGRVNPVRSFWSAGVHYQGLLPRRDRDVLALGVGQGRLSDRASPTASNETVLEAYYAARLTAWLTVTADVQYVFRPGGDGTAPNATVLGVRAKIDF